jgi:DNA modification methylase
VIHTGDCIEVMRGMEADSVDAVVTDPPYGLEFMGKTWDAFKPSGARIRTNDRPAHNDPKHARFKDVKMVESYVAGSPFQAWCEAWGREALRVTKPGGYLLAFGGTRTHHRLVCGLEDAGWIIRDELTWVYASGFPKGKANLKPAHEPIVLARKPGPLRPLGIDECRIGTETVGYVQPRPTTDGGGSSWKKGEHVPFHYGRPVTRPTATIDAWEDDPNLCASCAADAVSQGRLGTPATRASTTPKPAEVWPSEPDGSADTSVSPATSASSGEMSQAGPSTSSSTARSGRTRTGRSPRATSSTTSTETRPTTGLRTCSSCGATSTDTITTDDTTSTPSDPRKPSISDGASSVGRWPSNLLLSDPELFDEPNPYVVGSGATSDSGPPHLLRRGGLGYGSTAEGEDVDGVLHGDSGGYSRFFLIPKADRADREPVLRGTLPLGEPPGSKRSTPAEGRQSALGAPRENAHPTVKPTDLMRHLVRLVTPSGGTVLDPFLGSGSTALACELEGFPWVGIEKEPEYVAIAEARLNGTQRGLGLDVGAPTTTRKLGTDRGGGTRCSDFPGPCKGHPGHGKYGPTIHVNGEDAA